MNLFESQSQLANYRDMVKRENPDPSNVLGVFGLSIYTREEGLQEIFSKFGKVEKISIIYDKRERNRSLQFGFVTMESLESASAARDETNGMVLDGRKIRVDYSITKKPHSPAPGRRNQDGEPAQPERRGYGGGPRDREGYGERFGNRDNSRERPRDYGRFRGRHEEERGFGNSRGGPGFVDSRRPRSPMGEPRRRYSRSRSIGRGDNRKPHYDMSPRGRRGDSPQRFGRDRRDEPYRPDREGGRPGRGGWGNREGPEGHSRYEDRNGGYEGRDRGGFRDRDRERGRGPPPPYGRGRPMGYNRSPPYSPRRGDGGRSPPRRSYPPEY
ncbi:hypothetical protein BB559_001369 [Furculomyces boomerangus]|uniref:RRM domain-containing protein n=2 Tax=Harpellales TaxID=61421 RepID=A0A2T9Z297_9FUNG|nr:hypothetical protein BB559_001369 [Furculomyces boomerangus]PVZ98562.1 hypothetical protein BB558_005433 [Smittium angustum]